VDISRSLCRSVPTVRRARGYARYRALPLTAIRGTVANDGFPVSISISRNACIAACAPRHVPQDRSVTLKSSKAHAQIRRRWFAILFLKANRCPLLSQRKKRIWILKFPSGSSEAKSLWIYSPSRDEIRTYLMLEVSAQFLSLPPGPRQTSAARVCPCPREVPLLVCSVPRRWPSRCRFPAEVECRTMGR
jgi:hypothetical protein